MQDYIDSRILDFATNLWSDNADLFDSMMDMVSAEARKELEDMKATLAEEPFPAPSEAAAQNERKNFADLVYELDHIDEPEDPYELYGISPSMFLS